MSESDPVRLPPPVIHYTHQVIPPSSMAPVPVVGSTIKVPILQIPKVPNGMHPRPPSHFDGPSTLNLSTSYSSNLFPFDLQNATGIMSENYQYQSTMSANSYAEEMRTQAPLLSSTSRVASEITSHNFQVPPHSPVSYQQLSPLRIVNQARSQVSHPAGQHDQANRTGSQFIPFTNMSGQDGYSSATVPLTSSRNSYFNSTPTVPVSASSLSLDTFNEENPQVKGKDVLNLSTRNSFPNIASTSSTSSVSTFTSNNRFEFRPDTWRYVTEQLGTTPNNLETTNLSPIKKPKLLHLSPAVPGTVRLQGPGPMMNALHFGVPSESVAASRTFDGADEENCLVKVKEGGTNEGRRQRRRRKKELEFPESAKRTRGRPRSAVVSERASQPSTRTDSDGLSPHRIKPEPNIQDLSEDIFREPKPGAFYEAFHQSLLIKNETRPSPGTSTTISQFSLGTGNGIFQSGDIPPLKIAESPNFQAWKAEYQLNKRQMQKELKFCKTNGEHNRKRKKFNSFTNQSLESRNKLPALKTPVNSRAKALTKSIEVNITKTKAVSRSNKNSKSQVAVSPKKEPFHQNQNDNIDPDLPENEDVLPSNTPPPVKKAYKVSPSGRLLLVPSLRPVELSTIPICGPGFTVEVCNLQSSEFSPSDKRQEVERKVRKKMKQELREKVKSKPRIKTTDQVINGLVNGVLAEVAYQHRENGNFTQKDVKDHGRVGHHWAYTHEECLALYKHNAFVIRKSDLGPKSPEPRHAYSIFRIVQTNDTIILQKYKPKAYVEQDRIFHYATRECERIDTIDNDFRVEFQPLYYGVCLGSTDQPNVVHVVWRPRILPVLKYVFDKRPYFVHFKRLIKVLTGQVLTMNEVKAILEKDTENPAKKSWQLLTKLIEDLSLQILDSERWQRTTIDEKVKVWPRLTMSNKGVQRGRLCDACLPSNKRVVTKLVQFSGLPYDRTYHHPLGVYPEKPEKIQVCYICSQILMCGHRLYHLKNDMFGCVLEIYSAHVTNQPSLKNSWKELLGHILNHDQGQWIHEMFIDFCITLGEGYKTVQKIDQETQWKLKMERSSLGKSR